MESVASFYFCHVNLPLKLYVNSYSFFEKKDAQKNELLENFYSLMSYLFYFADIRQRCSPR